MSPKYIDPSSGAKAQCQVHTIGSSGEKRRNTPYRSTPYDSIKLDGDDLYTYTDTLELGDLKDSDLQNAGHSWVEGGRRDSNAASPENGIHIKRNVSVQEHCQPPPEITMTGDANSEEWITKENHAFP
jgi:hypothetical protein